MAHLDDDIHGYLGQDLEVKVVRQNLAGLVQGEEVKDLGVEPGLDCLV